MISILMAAYNGERFIAEQIDSILAQTVQDFVLYVQDDCSTDKTFEIARSYAEKHPGRIVVKRSRVNSGNAKYNFMEMMVRHRDEYLMLCDQDDVWLPDKIEITLKKMREMEAVYGRDAPLLLHTDLQVVDENLRLIHLSVKEMIGTAEIFSLRQMVLLNNVTGCTTLYNRALAEYLHIVPNFFVMHDWWLALVAITFGKMSYVPVATSLYRQHGSNSIGARSVHSFRYKLYKISHMREIRAALFDSYRQAGEFQRIYDRVLDDGQREFLRTYASLPELGKLGRLFVMRQEKLFRSGAMRTLSQIFLG